MDIIFQGQKRSGKSKNAVSLIKKYLSQGRRVLTNIDIFPLGLGIDFDAGLLVRIPDVPSADILDSLGHAYLKDDYGNFLHIGKSLRAVYQSAEVNNYNESYNGLIVIDESSLSFDSRNWDKPNQKRLLEWIIHSGKYGWDILYIIHDLSSIDKRIREQYINSIYVHRNFRDYFPPESRGWIPEFHIVSVYPSEQAIAKGRKGRLSRRFFIKKGIQKAYDTRQRFLPESMDVMPDIHSKTGFIDARCCYSVLPRAYEDMYYPPKPKNEPPVGTRPAGILSLLSMALTFGFPIILFIFFVSLIGGGSDEQTDPAAAAPAPTASTPAAPTATPSVDAKQQAFEQLCSYYNLVTWDSISFTRRRYSEDFLMQMFRYYKVEISNLYDYAGRPAFTLLFKSPNDGRIVDTTTDKELLNYGWVAYWWQNNGLMFINDNIWFFVAHPLPVNNNKNHVDKLFDALPVSDYLQ
jgi:hypothetical protein